LSDRPDYSSVVVVRSTDLNLPVDISAQTLSTLDVDITAQTLTELKVGITSSTITLDVDIAAQSLNELKVGITSSTVTLDVDIAAQTLSELKVGITSSTVTLDVDIAAQSLSELKVGITSSTVTLDVDITAQSVGNLKVDIAAQTLSTLKVDISAQTLSTLDVNIAAQTVSTLNIDIAAQTVSAVITQSSSNKPVRFYPQNEPRGVQFEPGASDTESDWYEVIPANAITTDFRIIDIFVRLTAANNICEVDVGTGAPGSETPDIVQDYPLESYSDGQQNKWQPLRLPHPVRVPANSRVAVRAYSDQTDPGVIGVKIAVQEVD